MTIAITEDHKALADTVADFAEKRRLRESGRALLETPTEPLASWWNELVGLGWLGLHIPEENGGSGYGLEELVVVVEQLGRAIAPGPFVPTVIASGALAAIGGSEASALLPGLADGSTLGTFVLEGNLTVSGGKLSGTAPNVMSGAHANVFLVGVGDDIAIVKAGSEVAIDVPKNMDQMRRSARVTFNNAPATIISGGRQTLLDISRLVLAAEAVGIARECTEMAADYAKVRQQFGRVIATFQAVKHHCANMSVETELSTSAVWDAARAYKVSKEQFSFACAVAASIAARAVDVCYNLTTQIHGGIAITWEHDAHLLTRRAISLISQLHPTQSALDVSELTRKGITRTKSVELPAEAEAIRTEVRAFAASIKGKSEKEQLSALIETGYVQPNWPKPYGRAAGAIEQLVIEEEFAAAGIERPKYGITGWVILTLIQHATPEQVSRWVPQTLAREVIWCQLFSEPDAGSDAAGVKTKATRVDGGWIVNGQKVWTSGAHHAGLGLATIRTNPDAQKHAGITTMVIDMHGKGVEVRPLKMGNGGAEFNEVFFTDVFVPDDDVVGPVDGGWTVARATLGNESVSIGGGDGVLSMPASTMLQLHDVAPDRLTGGVARIGKYAARVQALSTLNTRSVNRAVAGGGPGPEGAMAKLVGTENGHEAAEILTELAGPEASYLEGAGQISNMMVLMHRALAIAGGTSEIKRNQIGERILGLPRDPLIK